MTIDKADLEKIKEAAFGIVVTAEQLMADKKRDESDAPTTVASRLRIAARTAMEIHDRILMMTDP